MVDAPLTSPPWGARGKTCPMAGKSRPGHAGGQSMAMPKPSEEAKAAFTKLVPGEPVVTMRPMFGNLAAFVNGNMFAGLFGEDLFVRLSEDDGARVRRQGGRDFEPMPGRAMRGYVTVPSSWRSQPEGAKAWIKIALEQTRQMPPKAPAAKKPAAKKPAKSK
jgi:TfoX/Sxy family transcriptional regulator of competence genes